MNRGCELVLGSNNKGKYNVRLRDSNLIYIHMYVCYYLIILVCNVCLFNTSEHIDKLWISHYFSQLHLKFKNQTNIWYQHSMQT
jgi:hypothetical protein